MCRQSVSPIHLRPAEENRICKHKMQQKGRPLLAAHGLLIYESSLLFNV
jgi:hypothetical protein